MNKFLRYLKLKVNKFNNYTDNYAKISVTPAIPSRAYINWGIHCASTGDIDKAKELFETSSQMVQKTPEAYLNLAIYYARTFNFEEAIKNCRKTLKVDKYNSRAYSLWASMLTEQGAYNEAQEFYEKASSLDSRDSELYLNWGVSLAKQKKREEAEEKFKKSLFYNPFNYSAAFLWGVLLIEMEQYEKALDRLNLVLVYAPNHADANYYLALAHHRLEKYDIAQDFINKALAINSKRTDFYLLKAENELKITDSEDVLKIYEEVSETGLATPFFILSWGLTLQHFKKFDEASKKYLEILGHDDPNEVVLFNLSICYYNLNKNNLAQETLLKLLEVYPHHTNALALLGEVYYDDKDYDKAIFYYELAIKSKRNSSQLNFYIARAYYAKGEAKKASKYYALAVEYNPEFVNAYLAYARLLCELGDYKDAIRKIRAASKLDPDSAQIAFVYGYILFKNKNYALAIEKFDLAYSLDNSLQDALMEKAGALLILKEPEKILETLEKINSDYKTRSDFYFYNFYAHASIAEKSNSKYNIEKALEFYAKLESKEQSSVAVKDLLQKKNKLQTMLEDLH